MIWCFDPCKVKISLPPRFIRNAHFYPKCSPFNKYGQAPLPAIQGSQTPQPNEYNQIVPIGGRRSQISNITAIPAYAGDYAENRLRQVEDRLNMSEQSSRALLEEVVRLRGESFRICFYPLHKWQGWLVRKALAPHQGDPGSILGQGHLCELSCALVLCCAQWFSRPKVPLHVCFSNTL